MNDARTLKDFLMAYNSLTEICFKSCIDIVNNIKLEPHEVKCVDACSAKFIKLNHRFMGSYIKYQQERTQRTIDESTTESIKSSENEDVNVSVSSENTLEESPNVE